MSRGVVKFMINTVEDPMEQFAFRYVPDADYAHGTVSFGGYSRTLPIMRAFAEKFFGVQKPRQPQYVQVNKCWLSFRASYTEFTDAIRKLEKANMVVYMVRGFGNLVR